MPEDENITFVTDDQEIHREGKLDPTDVEILESAKSREGLITIKSVEELKELIKAASERFEAYTLFVTEHMTKEQAEFVRKLRVDEGYSWRAVARRCYGNHRFRDWPKWGPPSNQIMGMALCQRAAEMFGEDYQKPPWN
jgi:hypothetical protein